MSANGSGGDWLGLGGRIAVVTGGASGIGRATAESLARVGASVALLDINAEGAKAVAAEIKAKGGKAVGVTCDTTSEASVAAARKEVEAALGGADILVNNAGSGRGILGLLGAAPEDIDQTLGTNVVAAMHVVRAVVPGMAERKRGHLVNIGSVAGLYPLSSAVYGGSKGAIRLMNQNLRVELKGSGVRVTEVCPGRVATEIFDRAIDDPERLATAKDTGIEELTAQDIADAILFVLDTPWRVNVTSIEIAPNEQAYGGMSFAPAR
jgi:NADP-dependent 3-hydroxy acid dehydrogenase YdfG